MRRKTASTRLGLLVAAFVASQHALANPQLVEKLGAGVWRSLVVGGTNLYDFPLTRLGRQRFENFPLDRDPSLRCEPPGMPRAFYHLSPMDFRFTGETATIRYETMDVVRTVYMEGSPPAPSEPHTPNGYSLGRWVDDTLLVETTHLAAGETVREGVPKSAAMTLREVFSIDDRDDGPHLIVSVTLNDPENFSEPYTTVNEFTLEPDWELLPFDCQPTVY